MTHTRLAALLMLGVPALVRAHEGHGMEGVSHWHATDTAGLVLVAVLAALALWSTRNK
jgi:hypothetical protein